MVRAVGLIDPRSLIDAISRGQAVSDRNRRQSAVAELMPLALGGDKGAISRLSQFAPNLAMKLSQGQERRIIKGADGFNYYADSGERVLPGVEAKSDRPWWAPEGGSVDPAYLAAKKAGATNVSTYTNVESPKFQSEFDKTTGKKLGEDALNIAQQGAKASSRIGMLKRMRTALNTGISTGFGEKQLLSLRRAGKALGVDTGELGEAELLNALGNQLALELRNPSMGAGMPGAMSDKDREFLVASVPGLEKTPEGNKKLIDYALRVEDRKKEIAKYASEYRKKNRGRLDLEFYDALAQWAEATSLFPEAGNLVEAPSGPVKGRTKSGLNYTVE